MIALTLGRIAAITQARLAREARPSEPVTGPVVIDSRLARPGALFVALGGERADGHDFAEAAHRAGAAAVLGSRPVAAPGVLVEGGDAGVVAALGHLARHVLDSLPEADTVAITGSSGKTTTKDLVSQLLGGIGSTVAPAGSFNNEIGHPLTVLQADADTRFLVLEASARGIGHIAHLCGIAPPRVGVVLNVGTAHMGEFGSKEAIARAKGELVEALPAAEDGGLAVLNADDAKVAAMAERTRARVMTFGSGDGADVRGADTEFDDFGRARFTLVHGGRRAPVRLGLLGSYQVHNALAAAAVACDLGMAVTDVAEALSGAVALSRWRMEVRERRDGITVVNDAYNASPESMCSALETLKTIARKRRSFAVLGHMAELGSAHDAEHERVGALAAAAGVHGLVLVGEQALSIEAGARAVSGWRGEVLRVRDAAEAVAVLRGRLRPKDVVMVKGSRVAGLEQVAEALTAGGDAK